MYSLKNLTEEDLQYILILLTEGQEKVNKSKYLKAFHDLKKQNDIIGKVRNLLWNIHNQDRQDKKVINSKTI